MTNLDVSICIPVYNCRGMVQRAIASALEQTTPRAEVVVVDNCSTDGTWEAILALEDKRLRVFRNESNIGMMGNFNRCLELARGEYVRVLCADDCLAPNCLDEEILALNASPSAVLVTTRYAVVGLDGRQLRIGGDAWQPGCYRGEEMACDALDHIFRRGVNPFCFPSGVLFRRELALTLKGFPEKLDGLADVGLWLTLLEKGDGIVLDRFGCEITEHSNRGSYPLLLAGRYMSGRLELITDWESKYGGQSTAKHACRRWRELEAARCFWYFASMLARGQWTSAATHLSLLRRYRASLFGILRGIYRQAVTRLSRKLQPKLERRSSLKSSSTALQPSSESPRRVA